jgi:hypothetical protein
MTDIDPTTLLDELTQQLLRAGWNRTNDSRTTAPPPGRRTDQRSFTDPTRTVQVHACAYRESGGLETRLWGVDPHRPGALEPRWWAGTGALAPTVILAAARAATTPEPAGPHGAGRSVAVRLAAAGWHLTDRLREGTRLIEARWFSPDRSRSASWFPPDPPWDTGGWLITRPDQLRPDADIDTTRTPPAVTAALALTD